MAASSVAKLGHDAPQGSKEQLERRSHPINRQGSKGLLSGLRIRAIPWAQSNRRAAKELLDFGGASGETISHRRAFSARRGSVQMENLIARVATAADISPDVARKAVALIGDFIQREAPEEAVRDLFEKAPAFPAIIASSTQTGGEGMGVGLKGLMGVAAGAMGGGGLMALGSELLSLGLDMEQIQTLGKEVFAYAREVAGDQVVGEISASIPGLSQFI
jgi:hypothetical protein